MRYRIARAFVRTPLQLTTAPVPSRDGAHDTDVRVDASSASYSYEAVSYSEAVNGDIVRVEQNTLQPNITGPPLEVISPQSQNNSTAEGNLSQIQLHVLVNHTKQPLYESDTFQ